MGSGKKADRDDTCMCRSKQIDGDYFNHYPLAIYENVFCRDVRDYIGNRNNRAFNFRLQRLARLLTEKRNGTVIVPLFYCSPSFRSRSADS